MGRREAGDSAPDDGDRASELVFSFHTRYSEPGAEWMGLDGPPGAGRRYEAVDQQ